MASGIVIPDLGPAIESVKLIAWRKEEGQGVKMEEPICELETDKAVTELESEVEGVLLRQLFPVDSEIAKSTVIAYMGADGESVREGMAVGP